MLRTLKSAFREAEITACDLDKDGVDFCSKNLGAKPLYSSKKPHDIQTNDKYDLIWCGSLFTHLDFPFWADFMSFFQSALNPNGIFIFTTHGRYVERNINSGRNTYGLNHADLQLLCSNYEKNGFAYINYPQSEDYGISMSSPSHVMSLVEKDSDLRVLHYKERGWDNHQDVIACCKF